MVDTMTTNTAATVGKLQAGMKEAAETGVAQATAAFNAGIAEVSANVEKSQAQLKDGVGKAMKKAEEMASFNQGTVEALVKSGQIWASGIQDIGKQLMTTAQAQLDETVTTMKTLAGMRSFKDLLDAQANFTRAAMEKTMTETGKLTDASLKLAEQVMAPLTARVSLAVETLTKTN